MTQKILTTPQQEEKRGIEHREIEKAEGMQRKRLIKGGERATVRRAVGTSAGGGGWRRDP